MAWAGSGNRYMRHMNRVDWKCACLLCFMNRMLNVNKGRNVFSAVNACSAMCVTLSSTSRLSCMPTGDRKTQALRFNPSVSISLPVAPTSVSPFNSTLGMTLCFIFSFSCSSTTSSSSSSSSLLSSLATELLTNLHAILRINTNQNTLTACRANSNEKVMICEIQHLYCWVSQLSS